MHKLLARQLAKAANGSGEFELQALLTLVSEAYEQSDNDRDRTDRSIALMVAELEQLNRGLDQLVQERTAALREREAELEAQNLRFDAALKNMPYGLCMFNGDEHLIVCNERYGEMYGLTPEQTAPGMTLRSILDARIANGRSPADGAAYIKRCLTDVRRREPYYSEVGLRDGRTYAVNHRPMPDGGWVAIHQDITAQKQAESQITYMARHDGLTGLANRAVLLEKMEEAMARFRRHGNRFTIFVLDLDLFKMVNDSLGHPVGDELLKVVAGRLAECTRETDVVARLGGDEFAVLATVDGDQREAAIVLASRLLEAVAAPYDVDGHQLNIGTSIGVALAPEHGTEVDQLLKNADLALYKAKAEGRDAYRFFEDAMGVEARTRRAHQVELRGALANDEFELHYHPIVDIRTG
ncbi:MAG: diguanylate cyclase, partial [Xanthobacteraceae bacterium]